MAESGKTMELAPVERRQRERFERKSTQVAVKYLRRIMELPNMPETVKPFLSVLKRVYLDGKDIPMLAGRKKIGTFCAMVPLELIYAAGAVPIRLCSGSYTAATIGDGVVVRDACPLVKAVAGISQMDVIPALSGCRKWIVPLSCDCKRKTAGLLSESRDVYFMNLPISRGQDSDTEMFLQEMYLLAQELSKCTGKEITYRSLAEAMDEMGTAQYEVSRFLELRRQKGAGIFGTHVMAVMNAAAYMPVTLWSEYLGKLNDELEKRSQPEGRISKKQRPKIILTGSPVIFPNIKIPLLIEEMGGLLASDETCMGERMFYDPAVAVESSFDGMMRALANRYLKPCTCPIFSDNRDRIFRIRQMIRETGAEGVIYHVLRGCLVYDFEYQLMEKELEKDGIPVIRVESDYNEEDIEQLRIRIEAFIEMLKMHTSA